MDTYTWIILVITVIASILLIALLLRENHRVTLDAKGHDRSKTENRQS